MEEKHYTEEAYVRFEVAKLLNEKGFEADHKISYWKIGEDGVMHYVSSVGAYTSDPYDKSCFYIPENTYPCPTQQVAMRFLREEYSIYIELVPYFTEEGSVEWGARIYKEGEYVAFLDKYFDCFNSTRYELAVDSILKYCLEKLI